MKVYDGENSVLGRLASRVAQDLLEGEEVRIINAEKIVITGNEKDIKAKYAHRFQQLTNAANPRKGPNRSRRPDYFVKRVIRGMVPRKTARGREALSRLKVYIADPEQLKEKAEKYAECRSRKKMTVLELCTWLGWRGRA